MNHNNSNPDPARILNGRYEIIERLHAGAMGVIYRAKDRRLNRVFALKEMLIPGNEADRRRAEEWFEREARLLCSFRHPNIPVVTDFFPDQGKLWLVMDFIDGVNLSSLKLPVSDTEGTEVCRAALDIFKYIHKLGIIHRDIKTEHFIKEKESEQYFLVDFGTARFFAPGEIKTAIGTLGFASPEHYEGKADNRSDIYSLGAVLHHILSGIDPRTRAPFDFEPLRQVIPSASEHLSFITDKALAYYPADRFQSAEEMENCLLNPDLINPPANTKKTSMIKPSAFSIPLEPVYAKINKQGEKNSASTLQNPTSPGIRGQIINRLNLQHKGIIRKAIFADKNTIAVVFYSGEILFRNIISGADEGEIGFRGAFSSLCNDALISPDGRLLAQAMDDKRIFLWDLHSRRKLSTLAEHNRGVSVLAFCQSGGLLSSDMDGKVCFRKTSSPGLKLSSKIMNNAITALTISEDGRYFACGDEKGAVITGSISSLEDENAVFTGIPLHSGAVTGIFTDDNNLEILSSGKDGFIRLHKTQKRYNPSYQIFAETGIRGSSVTSLDFNRPSGLIAAGFDDGSVIVARYTDLVISNTLKEHHKPIESVVFSGDGSVLCSSDEDEIILWE
jgi:serine/threonine-protein kinase